MTKKTPAKKATKTAKQASKSAQLDSELHDLQDKCDAAEQKLRGAWQKLYESIAHVYYWWRKADAQKGYLDAKIKQMNRVFKKGSTHGINFSPVLRLVYGNSISDPDISKRNRLLNLLHAEYEKTPKKYGTDVIKLANYISANGGIANLVAKSIDTQAFKKLEKIAKQQGKDSDAHTNFPTDLEVSVAKQNAVDEAIDAELREAEMLEQLEKEFGHRAIFIHKPKLPTKIRLTPELKQAKLAADAAAYWEKNSGLGLIESDFGFETDTSNIGLALVKRDASGVSVINSFVDPDIIKQALTTSYATQYAALPDSLRCMYETLKTQLYPQNVAAQMTGKRDDGIVKKQTWMIDKKTKKDVSKQVPVKAIPRLVHTGNDNLFVLSPIATDVGVCTVARPNSDVLEKHKHDVFLLPYSKGLLERQVLNAGNINCYRPLSKTAIPAASEPPCSHRIKLTSIADVSDFYFVNFYPFVASAPTNYSQVLFDVGYEKKIKTKVQLPRTFVHAVAKNGADNWLAGKGNHANRSTNRYTQLTLSSKSLRLDFDYKDGKALASFDFPLPSTTKSQAKYTQKFVCLDLFPVLSALGALQLTTNVDVLLDANVAVFKFSTAGSDFVVAVPTCDNKGKRVASEAFVEYAPVAQPLTPDERIDIAVERYYAGDLENFEDDLDSKQVHYYE